jgi:hypothetical protein
MQKKMAQHVRSEFDHKLDMVSPCTACGQKHLGSAPEGHDLITSTLDDHLVVVKPPTKKPVKKRVGFFR